MLKKNRGLWEWDGEQYAKNSQSQKDRALAAIGRMRLKKGQYVLDVGCGNGAITQFIAEQVTPGKVVGIDKDPSMVKEASRVPVEGLSIIEADAVDFKLDQRFDVVTSFFCLQWVKETLIEKAFKNIFSHLKEGGQLCVLLPCYDFPHEIIKGVAFSEKWAKLFESYKEPQTFLSERYYCTLLEKIGFESIKIKVIHSTHLMTIQGFIDYTLQWCGCYMHMKDETLRKEFVSDIKEKLRLEKHNSDGTFKMVQQSLIMIAQKSFDHCLSSTASCLLRASL